jgi:hypothetical protein
MQAQGGRKHGAAVAIVTGVVYVLHVERCKNSAPYVQRVKGFHNVLAAIVQVAIAQQESDAAQGQILLMVA